MSPAVATRSCTIGDCDRPHKARGMCAHHYNKAYYQADLHGQRARARRWYQANPDKAAAGRRRRDPEAMRENTRRYYRRFRLKYVAAAANQKARRLGIAGRLTAEGIAARVAYFGGRCWICGSESADTIDHVKAMGRGGPNLHSNIRPACASCNYSRSWEGRR